MSVFRRNFRNVANMYYGHLVLPAAERETPAPTPQVEKESPRPAAAGRSNPTPDSPRPYLPPGGVRRAKRAYRLLRRRRARTDLSHNRRARDRVDCGRVDCGRLAA